MDIEKNKKILLIGASGLVGGLIAKFCEEKKYHQVQINRISLCKNSDLIEEIVTDFNDKKYLEDIPRIDHVCIAIHTWSIRGISSRYFLSLKSVTISSIRSEFLQRLILLIWT